MPLPDPTSLGLPAKPGSAPGAFTAPPITPTACADTNANAEPGPSRTTTCALCTAEAKYTCPRCAVRTCSLPCSKAHKANTGCSGTRDPAAYVPLAKFTQGTWDGDYAWLEDGRRKVAGWGEGLTSEELANAGAGATRGRGAPRGRGRGGRAVPQRRGKLDGLRWAVTEIGCDVDLLPEGMQRRRTNQSSWNPKSRALYLTVQLSIPGTLVDAEETQLVTVPRIPVLPPKATSTLTSLLPETLQDRTDLIFAIPYHIPRSRSRAAEAEPAPAPTSGRAFFPPIAASQTLNTALSGTSWVEFPTVHVFTREEWTRLVAAGEVAVMALTETKRKALEVVDEGEPAKKVKTDGLAGLLGDYGDSDEEEGEEVDDAVEALPDEDEEEGGDITLAPEMAAALGAALEADFGEADA